MKNETLLKTYVKRFAQSKTDYHKYEISLKLTLPQDMNYFIEDKTNRNVFRIWIQNKPVWVY